MTKASLTLVPIFIITLAVLLSPFAASAQLMSYEPLVQIPGLTGEASPRDFSGFVNAAYALSISLAALLAVVKIIIAGVKWMMTDKIGSISEAKSDIQGALFGLIIIICAVLIINIINPEILNRAVSDTPPAGTP